MPFHPYVRCPEDSQRILVKCILLIIGHCLDNWIELLFFQGTRCNGDILGIHYRTWAFKAAGRSPIEPRLLGDHLHDRVFGDNLYHRRHDPKLYGSQESENGHFITDEIPDRK